LLAGELAEFVTALAHRIASFPQTALALIKERVNAIALAPAGDFSRDSGLFSEAAGKPQAQSRTRAAMALGFQTRDAEMDLAGMLPRLAED
jgi:hypothetical protein